MAYKPSSTQGYDLLILVPTILLMGIGLVVLYSASSPLAEERFGDSYFYLKKQGFFCLLGIVIMVSAKNLPCTLYRKLVYPLLLLSFALLAMLLLPGIGYEAGGACRWLRFAGLSFQPSELAKFSLAVYIAYSLSERGPATVSFSKGSLPPLAVGGAFAGLILFQPDFGTAALIGLWILILLFVSGTRLGQIFTLLVLSAPAFLWLLWLGHFQHVQARIKAFLDPWLYTKDLAYQLVHSLLAFGSGGLTGSGLGNSKQKMFFLPESHTDFILSIAAEELGLLGVAVIILLFGILITRGIKIALNARDLYSTYLALALCSLIGVQTLVNMGVVTGLLPPKGLTLPFISYGGSALIINFLSIGVLLSVSARTHRGT